MDSYIKCLEKDDLKCQSKFIEPSIIKAMGGVNGYIKTGKELGIKFSDIKRNEPSDIIKEGNVLVSTINYSAVVRVEGQKIKTDAILRAISTDNGSTWFFTQDY